jgi:hypothetical protein
MSSIGNICVDPGLELYRFLSEDPPQARNKSLFLWFSSMLGWITLFQSYKGFQHVETLEESILSKGLVNFLQSLLVVGLDGLSTQILSILVSQTWEFLKHNICITLRWLWNLTIWIKYMWKWNFLLPLKAKVICKLAVICQVEKQVYLLKMSNATSTWCKCTYA